MRRTAFTLVLTLLGLAAAACRDARAQDGEMAVEGQVTQLTGKCPELKLRIGDQQVSTDAATRFEDGSCEDIVNGRRAEAEGMARDGILHAREVDLD
jgi:hypothetical protein